MFLQHRKKKLNIYRMRSKMSECFASASKSLHASFNRGPFEVVFWSVCVGTVYEILSSLDF